MKNPRSTAATTGDPATAVPGHTFMPRPAAPCLQGVDWVSFWAATVLAFVAYFMTLAPDVTLGLSGIFATGAMYAGVPHPPGYPLWTIYAWLFTKLLPFSNIAWRVAMSSAVAGAVTCGLVALMVSRGGAAMLAGFSAARRPTARPETALRVTCALVAGLGFAFDHGQWRRAVIVDPWPLSVMLFALTLTLLMCWFHAPARRGWLYAAWFVYGLSLSNSQLLSAAAFGLLVVVMLGDPALRREIWLACVCLFFAGLAGSKAGWIPPLEPQAHGNLLRFTFITVGVVSVGSVAVMTLRSRRLLSEWRPVTGMALALSSGVMMYFYMPAASMTTPPANWGYPRTLEGFHHLLSRGQYERIIPTDGPDRLGEQFCSFPMFGAENLGWSFVLAALIPFCVVARLPPRERQWLLGLAVVYFCLTALVMIALNPPPDRQAGAMVSLLFVASRLILAIWAGYGLILIGAWHAHRTTS